MIGTLLFVACDNEDFSNLADDEIAISYALQNYVTVEGLSSSGHNIASMRNITAKEADENRIDNVYILLFGKDVKRYYTSTTSFNEGEWNKKKNHVKIKLSQGKAGVRDVYIIANLSADLKESLDAVSDVADLKAVFETKGSPWSGTSDSDNLQYPILMSGMKNHNFIGDDNRVLEDLPLVRAFAKVELKVSLPAKHRSANESDYKYSFVDFDKRCYVVEKKDKQRDVVTSGNPVDGKWINFTASGADKVSSYKKEGGEITELTIVTYINETTNAKSYIELKVPYTDSGNQPPPEFGPATFILPRQGVIKRNYFYKYDVAL